MSKQFYVWKDRNCNGVDPEWVQLTGREYFRFIKDPANKERCFVTLDNGGDSDAGVIFMEATPEEYRKWRSEYRSHIRLLKQNMEFIEQQASLDAPLVDDEETNLHDVVADESVNVADEVSNQLDLETLREALKTLSPEEMQIINAYYFQNGGENSERKLASAMSIARSTLYDRRTKILKKLKNFSGQNRFSLASKEVEG